jgi:hypothetical protein
MKSEEELKKARGRLTEAEMATIRSLKGTLEMFEKDPYIEKIINLLKEGTKLD